MKISGYQPLPVLAKALPNHLPAAGAAESLAHDAGPTAEPSALLGLCLGTGIDIFNAAISRSLDPSGINAATLTIVGALNPTAYPFVIPPLQSNGDRHVAYPFLAPAASLPEFPRLADAAIELAVEPAVSAAVNTIGNVLLPSHPHVVQAIELVAGVIVVDFVKKELRFLFDQYNGRNPGMTRGHEQGI